MKMSRSEVAMERDRNIMNARCEAISGRITQSVIDELEKQQLAPEELILVTQDVAAFLLAMSIHRYQRHARKRVENLFINLMHLKLSVFDEAREHLKQMH